MVVTSFWIQKDVCDIFSMFWLYNIYMLKIREWKLINKKKVFITKEKFNKISDKKNVKLFDIRIEEEFNKKHLDGSIRINKWNILVWAGRQSWGLTAHFQNFRNILQTSPSCRLVVWNLEKYFD